MEQTEVRLKDLQEHKVRLIETYMKMQDEADTLNERIYNICCEVEALNLRIEAMIKEEEKRNKAAAKAVKSNGSHPPENGHA